MAEHSHEAERTWNRHFLVLFHHFHFIMQLAIICIINYMPLAKTNCNPKINHCKNLPFRKRGLDFRGAVLQVLTILYLLT